MASIFWFMLLFTWISMLITICGDLFRDHERSGWGKALWSARRIPDQPALVTGVSPAGTDGG